MKNLLIYINPSKTFDNLTEILVKIQIDNSLSVGWKREDLLLVTNFEYEHNGVRALVIGDDNYCPFRPWSSKIYAIVTLFGLGLIGNDTYWFHDTDAFQLEKDIDPKFRSHNIGMIANSAPMSKLYNGAHRWNSGSIFFKRNAENIFRHARRWMIKKTTNEERGFMRVELGGGRIKVLNGTYNFMPLTPTHFKKRIIGAKKPIKIIHFDPFNTVQNELSRPFLTANLMDLFNYRGI